MIDQILLNTSDKIEIDIYYNNQLSAADNVMLRSIKDPNSTVRVTDQLASADPVVTGRYFYTVDAAVTDMVGVYTAYWEFTIGSQTFSHTQLFSVVTTFQKGYTSPIQLRASSTYNLISAESPSDSVLQAHIDKATALIDGYLGGSLWYGQHSLSKRVIFDARNQCALIQLNRRPLIDVTSLTLSLARPTNLITINPENVRINSDAGYIEIFGYCPPHYNHSPLANISFTAGYTYVPGNVLAAANMLAEALYKETMGEGVQLRSFQIGDKKESYNDTEQVRNAKAMLGVEPIQGAMNLLKEFRHPRSILTGPL